MKGRQTIPPYLIRFRDAQGYMGMGRAAFNKLVRPYVSEGRIGKQGVVFKRLELDAWADEYMQRNGRPGNYRSDKWENTAKHRGLPKLVKPGISTSKSGEADFAKALDRVTSKKQRRT